jgi:hypothetical protein
LSALTTVLLLLLGYSWVIVSVEEAIGTAKLDSPLTSVVRFARSYSFMHEVVMPIATSKMHNAVALRSVVTRLLVGSLLFSMRLLF